MSMAAQRSDQLVSERVAGSILPRVLNSFDMVAIMVAIVISITNDTGFYGSGPVSLTWLIVGFLTFLIPGAIVTGQLGLLFPGEGSIYLWTYKAFGPFMSFFAGFAAWWPGVLVMLGSGTVVSQYLQYLFGATFAPWVQGMVILAVLLVGIAFSLLRLRLTQNAVNTVFVLYSVAMVLIAFSAVLWLIQGHHSYTNFGGFTTGAGGWFQGMNHSPLDYASTTSTWSLYGFMILALLGIEVPLNMGVEIDDVKAITRYLLWGSVVVMVAYFVDNVALLIAGDPAQAGNLAALLVPVKATMGPVAEWLVGLLLIGFFLFQVSVFSYCFARLLFVSGLDRRLPAAVSRVTRDKAPYVAIIVQAAITGLVTVIAFMIYPYLVKGDPVALSSRVYWIVQGSITVIWRLSMVFLFVDVLYIIRKYAAEFAARRIAHPAVFWVCAIVGAVASALGAWVTFTNPFTASLGKEDWWHAVAIVTVVSLLIVPILYVIGARTSGAGTPGDEVTTATGATMQGRP